MTLRHLMLVNTATIFGPEPRQWQTIATVPKLTESSISSLKSRPKNGLPHPLGKGLSRGNKHRTAQTRGFSGTVGKGKRKKKKEKKKNTLPALKMSAEDPCICQRERTLFQNVLPQY